MPMRSKSVSSASASSTPVARPFSVSMRATSAPVLIDTPYDSAERAIAMANMHKFKTELDDDAKRHMFRSNYPAAR